MQGLGATGQQQAKDCAFDAGSVPGGAPLRISWFLVIIFAYQVIEAVSPKNPSDEPLWVRLTVACINEFILLLTVLCHEMGHGTMAKRLGGEISQVLLWPFGGICFTTRPPNRDSRQKLVDDLWIVGAGPATHFPMSAIWLGGLVALRSAWGLIAMEPAWKMLIPLQPLQRPCFSEVIVPATEGCLHTQQGVLFHYFLMQAVQLNVMLFMFNVFFPMYPMDGAKLIVCSLQLFCGASARTAAKVLIGTSLPLSVYFIYTSMSGAMHSAGAMAGVSAYMGFMCLMETYKIYQLYKSETLHHHPLFETARAQVRSTVDAAGVSQRLNDSAQDDVESRAPTVQRTELQPFAGTGRVLIEPGEHTVDASQERRVDPALDSQPLTFLEMSSRLRDQQFTPQQLQERWARLKPQASGQSGRASWLAKMEQQAREQKKTVDQLQDERAERRAME